MTKQKLLETYTAEQIADKVIELETIIDDKLGGWSKHGISYNELFVMKDEIKRLQSEVNKYRKAFENAKKERDCQIAEYQKKIEELENHHKFSIMQIDDVLMEFLGVTHEIMDKPHDFEKVLQEVIDKSKTVADFLPTEPIKVADMLINAEGEYEHNPLAKALCGEDKGTYRIFDIGELRQIAEHLLIYCNHNKEVEE